MLTPVRIRRSRCAWPSSWLWGDRRTRYDALNADANRFARALRALGLKKGAKVGIVSRNLPEYAVAFFGTARSGLVLVNVSVLYAPEELQYVLDKADVQVLIYEDLFADKIAAVKPNCPKIETYIPIGKAFDDFIDGESAAEPDVVIGPPVNDIPVVPPFTPTDDTLAPAVMPSSLAA